MVVLPTVDQFSTFAVTHLWLEKRARQCIWYLPDKGRCCLIGITDEDDDWALDQADDILKVGPLIKSPLEVLAGIAERSCCARHYRNKIEGSGLAKELAIQWRNEVKASLYGVNFPVAQAVNLASASSSIYTV